MRNDGQVTAVRGGSLTPRRSSRGPADGLLDRLFAKRILFVAGKGGTGKTTVAAALALLAAKSGMQVLGVEAEPKDDLARALGSKGATFRPALVQPNVSVIALHAEESFQEYLRMYFKVPRLARVTPLARVFDFIATAVPGPRDMLVVGKIAFEEQRRDDDSGPAWDLIVVDCSSSGQVLAQLNAARAMLHLVRGGMIRSQVAWIDAVLSDPERTALVLTCLPEDMPVVETLELEAAITQQNNVNPACCVLNRVIPEPLPAAARRLLADLADAGEAVTARLDGIASIKADLDLADRLHRSGAVQARRLRAGIGVPVVEVPLVAARTGLATTRAVADALAAYAGGGG